MSDNKVSYTDPGWPDERYGEHPVTELCAKVAGGLSPFGETTFPMAADELPYVHPHTVVNS